MMPFTTWPGVERQAGAWDADAVGVKLSAGGIASGVGGVGPADIVPVGDALKAGEGVLPGKVAAEDGPLNGRQAENAAAHVSAKTQRRMKPVVLYLIDANPKSWLIVSSQKGREDC